MHLIVQRVFPLALSVNDIWYAFTGSGFTVEGYLPVWANSCVWPSLSLSIEKASQILNHAYSLCRINCIMGDYEVGFPTMFLIPRYEHSSRMHSSEL